MSDDCIVGNEFLSCNFKVRNLQKLTCLMRTLFMSRTDFNEKVPNFDIPFSVIIIKQNENQQMY